MQRTFPSRHLTASEDLVLSLTCCICVLKSLSGCSTQLLTTFLGRRIFPWTYNIRNALVCFLSQSNLYPLSGNPETVWKGSSGRGVIISVQPSKRKGFCKVRCLGSLRETGLHTPRASSICLSILRFKHRGKPHSQTTEGNKLKSHSNSFLRPRRTPGGSTLTWVSCDSETDL